MTLFPGVKSAVALGVFPINKLASAFERHLSGAGVIGVEGEERWPGRREPCSGAGPSPAG